jgi:hypothetical protein
MMMVGGFVASCQSREPQMDSSIELRRYEYSVSYPNLGAWARWYELRGDELILGVEIEALAPGGLLLGQFTAPGHYQFARLSMESGRFCLSPLEGMSEWYEYELSPDMQVLYERWGTSDVEMPQGERVIPRVQ